MTRVGKLLLIGAALGLAHGTDLAAQEDIGKREYEANCAVCHGPEAKGDGPMVDFLTQRVPSLATLSKANAGVFPFRRVYEIIDGRAEVRAHGPREMPVWGDEYSAEVYERHGLFYGQRHGEGVIYGRILALIAYISELQEE